MEEYEGVIWGNAVDKIEIKLGVKKERTFYLYLLPKYNVYEKCNQ